MTRQGWTVPDRLGYRRSPNPAGMPRQSAPSGAFYGLQAVNTEKRY